MGDMTPTQTLAKLLEESGAKIVLPNETIRAAFAALEAENTRLTAERDAADKQASECDRMLTSLRLNLERRLAEDLHYVPISSNAGHPHGFSVIHIPDWETRQIIAEIKEVSAASRKATIAEQNAEIAALQADRERLEYVLDEMYVYHGKVVKTRDDVDAARKAGA